MIYTVTFNPSLDYVVTVDRFNVGLVNRTKDEKLFAGGKGINVSKVLKNLGYENTALGFIAGFTGEKLQEMVSATGVRSDFIRVKEGLTRINVKVRADKTSEINGQGPEIDEEAIAKLYKKLDALKADDILVLAGSIPDVMPKTIYSDIMEYLSSRKVKIIVDATNELLVNVLKYAPFLVKPNNYELGEIYGVELKSRDEVIPYALKMHEAGARNVLVSMANEGAVLVDENGQVYTSNPPDGEVINPVGAGDSMVAGFLAGYLSTGDYRQALRMGLVAGSASAFTDDLATKEDIERVAAEFTE